MSESITPDNPSSHDQTSGVPQAIVAPAATPARGLTIAASRLEALTNLSMSELRRVAALPADDFEAYIRARSVEWPAQAAE